MSITFKWFNRNVPVDGFRVYRSTSPIADGALPAPLATVANNVFQYVDATVVRNTIYYYRVGAFLGGQEMLSPNRPLMFLPDTGPGPQKILRGDCLSGYFGPMELESLLSIDDFKSFYGLTWTTITSGAPTKWLKFIIKGKIVFWPDLGAFFSGVSINQIYQAGLMYGTNDDAIIAPIMKTNNGVVNQVRPYNKGDWQLIPRCPISRANRQETANSPASLQRGGEIDLAFAPAYFTRSFASEFPSLFTVDDLSGNAATPFFTSDVFGTSAITRGSATFDTMSSTTFTSTVAAHYRPVLELVF